MSKRVVVTGGGGFIGAYLVKKLVSLGYSVGVVDTFLRGDQNRLAGLEEAIDFYQIDVRDEAGLVKAFTGAQVVMHLAALNGTANFYTHPELVLDIGIRGMLAVVGACQKADVPDFIVASSAEVYQTPPSVPTAEDVPLCLPDSMNPRYSYGGSKIATELIAFNYGREHFRKMQVFRPHNVYGPDMGFKHVIPQFIMRALAGRENVDRPIAFPIQGDGTETRAFCYVDDVVDGILTMYERGGHREIYHIGNDDEISIQTLVSKLAENLNIDLAIQISPSAVGGTKRRCPDISKLRALGYKPKIDINLGLSKTIAWYSMHQGLSSANQLL